MKMVSLRDRQLDSLKQMINLNSPLKKVLVPEPVWKLLIYDKVCQDIISPLMSVDELRKMGVTLYLDLHSERQPIPDAPAVYFCEPTDENIKRLSEDFRSGLYDVYHLNFLAPISRQKTEDLAAAALAAGCVANIHKVFGQFLDFIMLEDDMFTLRHQNDELSYYSINRANIIDTEMDAIMDKIADSLFSIFATIKNVPIIRAMKGTAAEMVARKLEQKIRENLWDARNNLFHLDATQVNTFSFQRPLLVIFDRNIDMATPLHHTWTYQALAHDVLDLSLNRVVIDEHDESGQKNKQRTYELNTSDKFWKTHKGSPFPTVAEAIQEELEQYRISESEIKQLKTSMDVDGETEMEIASFDDTTEKLTNAVNSLPELMEKKRLIDMHTIVATSILDAIKERQLDTYFEIEEKIMSKLKLDRLLIEILKDEEFGQPDDKMRLFIIYYICTPHVSSSDFAKYEEILKEIGCDLSPLPYLQRWKSIMNRSSQLNSNQYEGGVTKTVSMFSKLLAHSSSFVMEGVKNLVVKRHNLPVTKITEQLMECRSGGEADEYIYLDPKLLKCGETIPKSRAPFQDAIVFVVGGGNYIEYQNLVDFIKQKQSTNKRVIYGTTTLVNSKDFLDQLSSLGQEMKKKPIAT